MPANFKTYESQARLLAAVIAAHPELKLNYKAISKAYGATWSESGIEHYFRPLKKAALGLRDLVTRDQETTGFDVLQIKVGSNSLAAGKSDDVSAGDGQGGGAQTPSSAVSTPKTGRKRAAPRSGTLTKSTGKRQTKKKKAEQDSDEEDHGNVDYEALDSPSRDRGRKAWINRDESTWLPDPAQTTPRAGNAASGNTWPGHPISSQSTSSDASATVTPSATFTAPSFSTGYTSQGGSNIVARSNGYTAAGYIATSSGNGYSASAPARAQKCDIKAEPLNLPLSFSFETRIDDDDDQDDYAV